MSYKKRFQYTTLNKKKIKLFYGNLLEKYLKKITKTVLNKHRKLFKNYDKTQLFLELLEQRLDSILYRSHFAYSILNARQLITHKHIKVNYKTVTNNSYMLKKGDIITINPKSEIIIEKNLNRSHFWPIPPKYLQINYKTFQIIFHDYIKNKNMSNYYNFRLDINNLINHYR